jgi:hypothetical protein
MSRRRRARKFKGQVHRAKKHKPQAQRRAERCQYAPCVECGKPGKLKEGREQFPDQPDRADQIFYVCECGAWVMAHRGSGLPLGFPGNSRTRYWRARAHEQFDPLWRELKLFPSRDRAYVWLASRMGMDSLLCHIGKMDADQAHRVTRYCLEYRHEAYAVEKEDAAPHQEVAPRSYDIEAFQAIEANLRHESHGTGTSAHGPDCQDGMPDMRPGSDDPSRSAVAGSAGTSGASA